jgi:hypothetical protein
MNPSEINNMVWDCIFNFQVEKKQEPEVIIMHPESYGTFKDADLTALKTQYKIIRSYDIEPHDFLLY